MANVVKLQTIVDGPRNVVIKAVGILDTSDVSLATFANFSALGTVAGASSQATEVSLIAITYSIEPGLAFYLYWDATSDEELLALTGSSPRVDFSEFGGLINNSGAGKTGNVLYATQGWASTQTLSYSVIAEFAKR